MYSVDIRHNGIKACSISLSSENNFIVKKAQLDLVKPRGFNLLFNYADLIPESLKYQLHLHSLWYKKIHLYVPDMEMDLQGKVIGTQHLGSGNFEVRVEFPKETPNYWRECLFDLFP